MSIFPAEINPRTGQEYYCGSVKDIQELCRVLNIGDGKAQKINSNTVRYYMDMVELLIDGYLQEYYFTPIRPYNQMMPNGQVVKMFPGRVRVCAQQWAAGLMMQSEFQKIDSNSNENVDKYIESARKEIHQMNLYNQRIPGQVYKSGWGRSAIPTMQPGIPPEPLW